MSLVHLHLLLNHFPVIGMIFGTLLLAAAVIRRSGELAKISFALLALIGGMSILVFMTGEPAQEAIEKLPGFSERIVDRHEDAARIATFVIGTLGALALGALLVYRRRPLPPWMTLFALIGAVGSAGLLGYAANLGGQIRHTEIRASSAAGAGASSETAKEEAEKH